MNIEEIVKKQREFFLTHKTLNIEYRKEKLKLLRQNIKKYQKEIYNGLYLDLNKPEIESLMCEISICVNEIDYFLKNLKKLAKPKKVKGTMANFPSKSYSYKEPYGVTLIMSPWNYPFLLAIQPLIESISAGNTAILKVGNASINTSTCIKKIIKETFSEDYVYFLEGDRTVNQDLLKQKFDYVFFTGSKEVGKIVLKAQSEFLTPVTLELGGKSPTIIDKTADLSLASKRICFGKILNCGQTCVSPDYILIDKSIKEEFLSLLSKEIHLQLGEKPLENKDYGKIINQKHFDRLINLLENQNIVSGGKYNISTLKIEPTIVEINDINNSLMKEEIFGPILPIIAYENEQEIFDIISYNLTPLALYYFGKNKKLYDKIIKEISFGGGCINDTIMHLTSNMSFGGVGQSGMGSYHREKGFETFSHTKNILVKKGSFDLNFRYRPYTDKKIEKLKILLDD